MYVLRIGEHKRKRSEAFAHIFETKNSGFVIFIVMPVMPQVDLVGGNSLGDDFIRKSKLRIEFQRAGLNAHCTRLRARSVVFVDNSERHASARET